MNEAEIMAYDLMALKVMIPGAIIALIIAYQTLVMVFTDLANRKGK